MQNLYAGRTMCYPYNNRILLRGTTLLSPTRIKHLVILPVGHRDPTLQKQNHFYIREQGSHLQFLYIISVGQRRPTLQWQIRFYWGKHCFPLHRQKPSAYREDTRPSPRDDPFQYYLFLMTSIAFFSWRSPTLLCMIFSTFSSSFSTVSPSSIPLSVSFSSL